MLFFEKGRPTKEVWYYEHPYPEGYKSTPRPSPCGSRSSSRRRRGGATGTRTSSRGRSPSTQIRERGFNLDIANPNAPGMTHEDPEELLARFDEERAAAAALREQLRQALAAALAGGDA